MRFDRTSSTRPDHVQSVKEVLRHLSFRTGTYRALLWRRRRSGGVTRHLAPGSMEERFRLAYGAGAWVLTGDQESRSGTGSALGATSQVRERLPELLAELGCGRVVDVGCGDWHWMREVDLPCDYVGIDVVPEVIEANRRYERPGVAFMVGDARVDPLPPSDLVLCRDVLFHLSFDDAFRLIANVASSTRWLLATTDTAVWFNSDIPSGDYRRINLQRRPYRLPPPAGSIQDDAVIPGRILGLWRATDISIATKMAATADRGDRATAPRP